MHTYYCVGYVYVYPNYCVYTNTRYYIDVPHTGHRPLAHRRLYG